MPILNPYAVLNVSKTTLIGLAWGFGLMGLLIGTVVGTTATTHTEAVIHHDGMTIQIANETASFTDAIDHQFTTHNTIHQNIQRESPMLCPLSRTEKLERVVMGVPNYCQQTTELARHWNQGVMQVFSMVLFPYVFGIANVMSAFVYTVGLTMSESLLIVGVVGVVPPGYWVREKYKRYKYK